MRDRSRFTALVVAAMTGGLVTSMVSLAPARAATPLADVSHEILVKYRPAATPADMASAEQAAGTRHTGDVYGLGVRVVEVPSDRTGALARFRHDPLVAYAEPNASGTVTDITPNDPDWSQEWGDSLVRLPSAWSSTTGSSSVVVAVLDTGVDASQPDLSSALIAGWDFIHNDSNPADDHGHGTETAGIVAARGNNGIGVAGTCWVCSVMPVKVADSSGSAPWSAVSSGITWAVDHGAQIISMSLSGTSGSTTLSDAVAYAQSHGVMVFAAAGNNGNSDLTYPASYPGVISVAGSDSKDGRYSWSTYGPWVDVAAPGCNMTTVMGGGYGSFCGTSAATPLAASVAALTLSYSPTSSASTIESAMETTAVPVSYVANGRIDAAATLAAVGGSGGTGNPPPPPPPPPPTTVTTTFSGSLNNKSSSKSFTVNAGQGSLSASVSFSKASSLTLALLDSSGSTVATATGPSVLQLGQDVPAGSYTLVVSGSNRASFTLTVTNAAP